MILIAVYTVGLATLFWLMKMAKWRNWLKNGIENLRS
jgi:hypothetical protein